MKKTLWLLGTLLLLFILGTASWILRDDIERKIDLWFAAEPAPQPKKVSKGVSRKSSYIGRVHDIEQMIDHDYYDLASLEAAAAIRQKPNLFKPYDLLGEIYVRTQNLEKLGNLITEMETKFPNEEKVKVFKVRKLITEENFGEALNTIRAIPEPTPEIKFYKSILLALQNSHTEAQKTLEELVKVPVGEVELKVEKSKVVEEAVVDDTVDNTEEMSEEVESEFFVTHAFSQKIKDLVQAYSDFEEYAEGDNPHLFAKISKVLAENNEAVFAKKFADIAIKEDISYIDAWILRGYANFLLKHKQEAVDDLRHAYELDSIRPETHYFLALALLENGEDAEATLFFEKSLEHDFEFSDEVRWRLIELFTKAEKFDRVIELYRELLDEESDPKEFVNALNLSINILQKPEFALEITESLIENKSDDVFTINIHAWALIANKKFHDAEQWLDIARKLEVDNPRTYLNYGLLYEEQAKFSQAKEFYKKAYQLGQNAGQISITNLAGDRYNELFDRTNGMDVTTEIDRPASAP